MQPYFGLKHCDFYFAVRWGPLLNVSRPSSVEKAKRGSDEIIPKSSDRSDHRNNYVLLVVLHFLLIIQRLK